MVVNFLGELGKFIRGKWVHTIIVFFAIAFTAVSVNNNINYYFFSEPKLLSSEVINPHLTLGQPLQVHYSMDVPERCLVFTDKDISEVITGKVVLHTVTPVNYDSKGNNERTIIVPLPDIPVGSYLYKATVHFNCSGQKFTIVTDLMAFTISPVDISKEPN